MSLRSSSPSQAMLRLMSDLKEVKTTPPEGVSASPINDENLFVWNASIFGPDDTPWEGNSRQNHQFFNQNLVRRYLYLTTCLYRRIS